MTSPDLPSADLRGGDRDARAALSYLLWPEADDYIAIMDVLEASVSDLSPAEVARAVEGRSIPLDVAENRLEALRACGATHATTDTSRILRHSDLLARNWRYTATAVGRQVHRFYRTALAGTPAIREIPLAGLNRVVRALEALRAAAADTDVAEAISSVFINHDDLDSALVGAEDAVAGLADRFDLDDETTAELRGLLVDYATKVAAELDDGAVEAAHHLRVLQPRFAELAAAAVEASTASALIERGALVASRGGRVTDWEGLAAWFDPASGRSARFSMRLVRALPGMHANIRRLHTSAGAATSRSRALRLAAACVDPTFGPSIALAALGDHPWRKLFGEADDDELLRNPSWEAGPPAPAPELLALTGRGGAGGTIPRAVDDTAARLAVAAARAERQAEHARAVAEVLAAAPGQRISARAAAVALDVLMVASRRSARGGARTGDREGLACTIVTGAPARPVPAVSGPVFEVWAPGRTAVFHRHGERVGTPVAAADRAAVADVVVERVS